MRWFSSYQSFSEIGIKGKRDDRERYRFTDFSRCEGKVVVDYGCNLGQACVKARKAGARRVVGFDSQADTIGMASEIARVLGTEVEYYVLDFNDERFREKALAHLGGDKADVSLFLSVYRTKELKDRDGLFEFILGNTKDVVLFEGHAMPGLDTEEYYAGVFSRFPVRWKFLGYTREKERTRPFFEVFPARG